MRNIPKLLKLEDDPIWIEVNSLVEYIYSKLAELPDDEKWNTTSKLRESATGLLFYTSQALGDASPSATEYDWGSSRKHASSLKTMYRFAGRQKFIELEPEIMVRLDALLEQIDTRVIAAFQRTNVDEQHDLDHWRKKYKSWKDKQNEG